MKELGAALGGLGCRLGMMPPTRCALLAVQNAWVIVLGMWNESGVWDDSRTWVG